jgi:hypothetical protein
MIVGLLLTLTGAGVVTVAVAVAVGVVALGVAAAAGAVTVTVGVGALAEPHAARLIPAANAMAGIAANFTLFASVSFILFSPGRLLR